MFLYRPRNHYVHVLINYVLMFTNCALIASLIPNFKFDDLTYIRKPILTNTTHMLKIFRVFNFVLFDE